MDRADLQAACVGRAIHSRDRSRGPVAGVAGSAGFGVVGITVGGAMVRGDMILASDTVDGDTYGWTTSLPGMDCEAVADMALRAARALDIRDYGRVDFRVTDEGEAYFIEASVQPHIASNSSFFASARARGLGYSDMLDELLAVACLRTGVGFSQGGDVDGVLGWSVAAATTLT